MDIKISNAGGVPIYEQIVSQIKAKIIAGELREGDALPSMRLLAKELRISVITTKRAYEELEREGFIITQTGRGSFVAPVGVELLREEQPRHFVFIMDGHGKHFRHELFPAYKANRPAPPEGLIAQIEPMKRMVASFGLHKIKFRQGFHVILCVTGFHRNNPLILSDSLLYRFAICTFSEFQERHSSPEIRSQPGKHIHLQKCLRLFLPHSSHLIHPGFGTERNLHLFA